LISSGLVPADPAQTLAKGKDAHNQ
jgi:hypothetical protein